jgi:hypothetical protein
MRVPRATKLLGLTLAVAVVGSLAPAGAETLPTPRFRDERTYVHCGETPKAQTLDASQGRIPTWDTTAPTTSVQQGGGCGTFDPPVSTFGNGLDAVDNSVDMLWTGTFAGNLDSIVVHAHAIWLGAGKVAEQAQDAAVAGLTLELTIDGDSVTIPASVSPKIVRSSTGASSEFVFSIADLGLVDPVTDVDADGIADDEGATERTIRLQVRAQTIDNPFMVWVWDTTEVPSGLHFNGPVDGPVLTPEA